jgi:tRNA threonylcarbamoyladenosine biosynthesis protein TsaB
MVGFRGAGAVHTIATMAQGQGPRIVAIETTARRGGVALGCGDEVLRIKEFSANLRHAAELLVSLKDLCEQAGWRPVEVDEIYVSAGPGSFTGSRIGVTVARTLAQAVGSRIVPVPTMDVLACNALRQDPRPQHLAVLLDAQRRQSYVALFSYRDDRYVGTSEVKVGKPAELLTDRPVPCAAMGEGIAYHRQAVESLGLQILPEDLWQPRAENVFRVGRTLAKKGRYVELDQLIPIYVRLPEAEEKWREHHGPPR